MFNVSLKSFGAFLIFRFLATLYLENGWSYSETDQTLGLRSKYLLYTEYFWLLSIESHSEVIWCISDFFHFRQPCVLQAAGCRTIQTKIWASGASTCSRSVWGHLVHFQCFQFSITLYLKKRLVTEWNWPKFGPRGLTYCVVPMNIRIWLKWSWGTTSLPERHSPSDK